MKRNLEKNCEIEPNESTKVKIESSPECQKSLIFEEKDLNKIEVLGEESNTGGISMSESGVDIISKTSFSSERPSLAKSEPRHSEGEVSRPAAGNHSSSRESADLKRKSSMAERRAVRGEDLCVEKLDLAKKQSRVDPDKYQASVSDNMLGDSESLSKQILGISQRCKFGGQRQEHRQTIDEFLQFIDLVDKENSFHCAYSPWLCGSCRIEQMALDLLHNVDYSLVRAKFLVLFPVQSRMHPSPLDTLTEEALGLYVENALHELIGFKEDEKAKIVGNILEKMKTEGIEVEELMEYLDLFSKHGWEIPRELEQLWNKAKELSFSLRSQLENKMPYEAAMELLAQSHNILTPEIKLAREYAEISKRWISRAQTIQGQWTSMKALQRLVNEAKNIQVKLPGYEKVVQRYEKANSCITKLYKFLKSHKTRTGTGTEKCSEDKIKSIIQQANEIQLSHPDIEKQREELKRINEWKCNVFMTFEDTRVGVGPERITSLLNEAREFRFSVNLISELEATAACYRWQEQVRQRLAGGNRTSIKTLQTLINEGEIGFEFDIANDQAGKSTIEEVCKMTSQKMDINKQNGELLAKMKDIVEQAQKLKANIQRCLKGDKVYDFTDYEKLYQQSADTIVDMKEKHSLSKAFQEILKWKQKCESLLTKICRIEELEEVKRESDSLNVTSDEYARLIVKMQPVSQWLQKADKYLEKFKSPPSLSFEQIISLIKKKESSADLLSTLLGIPNDILIDHYKYKALLVHKENLEKWKAEASSLIEKYLSENFFSISTVRELLQQAVKHPISKEIALQLIDMLEHKKWLENAQSAYNNKVPIHVLESNIREGNSFSIKTEEIKRHLSNLESKVVASKQWLAKYRVYKENLIEKRLGNVRISNLEEMLHEGEALNVKIRDLDYLSEKVHDITTLISEARRALQGHASFSALETLIANLDKYDELVIDELELLKALHRAANCWREIAHKVIKSRPSLSLSLLHSLPARRKKRKISNSDEDRSITLVFSRAGPENALSLDSVRVLNEFEEEKSAPKNERIYCICRTTEETKDMIACDECNEWFHFECIGITPETSQRLKKFICMGCCKRNGISPLYSNNSLRMDEKSYDRLIKEGQRFPLQLVELKHLIEVQTRLDLWKKRVGKILDRGLEYSKSKNLIEALRRAGKKEMLREIHRDEDHILQIFLESENYPVETEIGERLLILLHKRDWMKEAIQMKYSKLSIKKAKELLEMHNKLKLDEHPELNELKEFLQGVCEKPGVEEAKAPAGHMDSFALSIQRTIETHSFRKSDIFFVIHKLAAKNNHMNDPMLIQLNHYLKEEDNFTKKAKEMLSQNPNDVTVLERICQCSLSLKCIPDDIEEWWNHLRRLSPSSTVLKNNPFK